MNKNHNRAQQVYNLDDKNLLNLIDELKIIREEKFAETYYYRDKKTKLITGSVVPSEFPWLTIIGPTKNYYEKLIPKFRDDLIHYDGDNSYDSKTDIYNNECLSQTLDDANDDASAHNQSSMMILFEPSNDKRFFFMGDAGLEAFDKIGKYHKKKINNISWLKVPHHGSKHNMNSSIIKWLNPNIAYISTEKVGNYLNMCTVNALKHNNCVVYSTHKGGNKVYNLIVEREGYSTAESL